jgi:hypothetical protein
MEYLCRYPDDSFDRYWFPEGVNSTFVNISTTPLQSLSNVSVIIDGAGPSYPPPAVLETALTTTNSMRISFPDTISRGYLGLYFAELDPTANNYSRQFEIQIPQASESAVINPYKSAGLDNISGVIFLDLLEVNYFDMIIDPYSNTSVSLGPLVNALEFCELMQNEVALLTNDQDGELSIFSLSVNFLSHLMPG